MNAQLLLTSEWTCFSTEPTEMKAGVDEIWGDTAFLDITAKKYVGPLEGQKEPFPDHAAM